MLLKSLAAIGFAHLLPGLFFAKLLDLGRSQEERLLMAAILGGPVAAFLYLAVLLTGIDALFWVASAALGVGAILFRARRKLAPEWPGKSLVVLGAVLALVLVPYLVTTGSTYRVDEKGDFVLDRALQRDVLFHLGIARSLETSYPPRLLSVSGESIGYHPGYHLQLALWARFFGIAPEDGLVRVGSVFHIVLFVLSAYLLARRLFESEKARLLSSALVLGSGFGYLLFFRPSVDWWSLTFMDWALVSIFLANPLLAALPLLFVGLTLLHDYQETGARGALAGGVSALAFLFLVKMFLGAQALAAMALAALWTRERRTLTALAALSLASSPLVLQTVFAATGSNTAVSLRPLEIVRYSMEKISFTPAVEALAEVGRHTFDGGGVLLAGASTLLWLVGFLGLRLLGLATAFRDLSSRALLPATLAWFAVIGFPLSLLLRIAPAEAQGLSRLEALNDAGWFATASGIVLWFPTAGAISRRTSAMGAVGALAFLALPSTAQHFVHAASLGVDRIGRSRVEAALEAGRISSPASVWVEPPDRARPSLLAYFAARASVYDAYVNYDYMFFGREEIDYRRHAVAQFWASKDPAYLAWFLKRYRVDFVWREDRELPATSLLSPVFTNEDVELSRVNARPVEAALRIPLSSPEEIAMGGRGQPYFGSGWMRPEGGSTHRVLPPGRAKLYLPLENAVLLDFTLEAAVDGALRVNGTGPVASEGGSVRFALPAPPARGLQAIDVEWSGPSPLLVSAIRMAVVPLGR
jgi:hypothetical protein